MNDLGYGTREFDILYLQTQALHEYSRKKHISLAETSKLFDKHNIFNYISENYDYIHLHGIVTIVDDIQSRIKNGVVYTSYQTLIT
jgi:hypothetical protein